MNDSHLHLDAPLVGAHFDQYKDFRYRIAPDPFMLLLDSKDLIHFDTLNEMQRFVDQVTDALHVRLGDWHLHLTGCKRCARTMNGVKFDPCERGKVYLSNAKTIALTLARAGAEAIEQGRKDGFMSGDGTVTSGATQSSSEL